MTKVSIIEIDLGDIKRIISENVAELHGDAKEKLDNAIEERKKVEEIRIKREQEKTQETILTARAMLTAYDKLAAAEAEGNTIPAEDILEMIKPSITTASAFTIRMKTILREQGNVYIIKRKQVNKVPHYYFERFNGKTEED